MSRVFLTRWGNSVGVRIPMNDVKSANAYIGEQFELEVNEFGGFTLKPIDDPQKGWLEAFNAAADAENDELLLKDISNDFDKDDWTW